MRKIDDSERIGTRVGRWEIIGVGSKTPKRSYLVCRCDCGNQAEVLRENILSGKSDGCKKCSGRNGMANPAWRGVGHIPQNFFGIMCKSAEARGIAVSVDIVYINELWLENGGTCSLSGVPIEIGSKKNGRTTASVDRIDGNKGYERGNLQFVHKDINLMKNRFDEEYFIAMCKMVAERAAG